MDIITLVLTELSSFGQYIYGIYLGFNGEILSEVCSIPDIVCSSIESSAISYSHRAVALPATTLVYWVHPHTAWVQRRKACFGGVFWFIAAVYKE